MITVKSHQDDKNIWYLICEDLDLSLSITEDIGLMELAKLYGWTACECGLTDGTTACNHKTSAKMLHEAKQVLSTNVGWEVDLDPSSSLWDRLMESL